MNANEIFPSHPSLRLRTCSGCGFRKPRPGQRTCQPCHTDYKRAHEQKRRTKAKNQYLAEYLTGQLSLGG